MTTSKDERRLFSENKYHSFNADKILTWESRIISALRGEKVPPVTINLDPTSACNLQCYWCNAWRVRERPQMLSEKRMKTLAGMFVDMEVAGMCIAGGGEPTLNPYLFDFVKRVHQHIAVGLITNGMRNVDKFAEYCRWIGFSVDSATPQTFKAIKGIDGFDQVIKNMKSAVKEAENYGRQISYKFLITHENMYDIYPAVLLAKHIGVHEFHIRPVSYKSTEKDQDKNMVDVFKIIEEMTEKAKELEDDSFRIFSTGYKFGKSYEESNDFPKCNNVYSATFCADGYVYLCPDRRGDPAVRLCEHEHFRDYWLSIKHKNMLRLIDPAKCPRCTYGVYNKAVDSMVYNTLNKELL